MEVLGLKAVDLTLIVLFTKIAPSSEATHAICSFKISMRVLRAIISASVDLSALWYIPEQMTLAPFEAAVFTNCR